MLKQWKWLNSIHMLNLQTGMHDFLKKKYGLASNVNELSENLPTAFTAWMCFKTLVKQWGAEQLQMNVVNSDIKNHISLLNENNLELKDAIFNFTISNDRIGGFNSFILSTGFQLLERGQKLLYQGLWEGLRKTMCLLLVGCISITLKFNTALTDTQICYSLRVRLEVPLLTAIRSNNSHNFLSCNIYHKAGTINDNVQRWKYVWSGTFWIALAYSFQKTEKELSILVQGSMITGSKSGGVSIGVHKSWKLGAIAVPVQIDRTENQLIDQKRNTHL